MNQIPNIEEEPLPSIDELLKRYFDTPTGGAAEYVDIADIRSLIYRAREEEKQTHHQQLQSIHTSLVAAVEGHKLPDLGNNSDFHDGYNAGLNNSIKVINSIFKE